MLGSDCDPYGTQWIELYNNSESPINLQGYVLTTDSGSFVVISPGSPLWLKPKARLVITNRIGDGPENTLNLGNSLNLDPNQDSIDILQNDEVVDSFIYGDILLPKKGVSFDREPDSEDTWCYSRLKIDDMCDDIGTPGGRNTYCDNDGDGFAEDQGDCDDTNKAINPTAKEVCNGLDDNCNGETDEGVTTNMKCLDRGVCKGTVPRCMGSAGFMCVYPPSYEKVERTCDGLDNDCDGLTDEDLNPEGHCLNLGVCKGSKAVCEGSKGWVCNYPSTYEKVEHTCDGLDNDCDGLTDEGFIYNNAGISMPCEGIGECSIGIVECSKDHKKAVCSTNPGGSASEAKQELCDGLDNDCDGLTDEDFHLGVQCTVGKGICKATGIMVCSKDHKRTVCNATPGKPAVEICGDHLDNDCDGQTDEKDCVYKVSGGGGCTSYTNKSDPMILVLLLFILITGRIFATRRSFL